MMIQAGVSKIDQERIVDTIVSGIRQSDTLQITLPNVIKNQSVDKLGEFVENWILTSQNNLEQQLANFAFLWKQLKKQPEYITFEDIASAHIAINTLRNLIVTNRKISVRWYGYDANGQFYIYDLDENKALKYFNKVSENTLKTNLNGILNAAAQEEKQILNNSLLSKTLNLYVKDTQELDKQEANKNNFYRWRKSGRKTTHRWVREEFPNASHLLVKGKYGKSYNEGNLFEAFDDATYHFIGKEWHNEKNNFTTLFEKNFSDSLKIDSKFGNYFFTESLKLDNIKGTKQGDVNDKQIKANVANLANAFTLKNRVGEIIIGLRNLITMKSTNNIDMKQIKKDFENLIPNNGLSELAIKKLKENFRL